MSADVELFEQVNEHDVVIGVTAKADAHANGHIHRVAAVYVFDVNGSLYVQHHLKAGLLDHSVGGHIVRGESYDDGAAREASEELGITQPLTHVGTFYSDETYTGANYRHMFGLYECTVAAGWEFKANDEVKRITPMKIEDIVSLMNAHPERFTPGFLNSMEYYIQAKGLPYALDLSAVRGK